MWRLGLFAVLALLAWQTLPDERFRLATLLVIALFAVRTVVHLRYADKYGSGKQSDEEDASRE